MGGRGGGVKNVLHKGEGQENLEFEHGMPHLVPVHPPLNNDCSLRSVISTTKSAIILISKKHSHLISSHNISALSSRQWMIINETSTRQYCFDV